ncbi:MAG TPA: hypothetical protein VF097_01550 [Actinomycetota bacterium]
MGVWLAAGAATATLLIGLVLRTRLPAPLGVALMVAASAALAWGGVLLREDPSAFEAALATSALAIMGPLHVRIVLGPYGPPR